MNSWERFAFRKYSNPLCSVTGNCQEEGSQKANLTENMGGFKPKLFMWGSMDISGATQKSGVFIKDQASRKLTGCEDFFACLVWLSGWKLLLCSKWKFQYLDICQHIGTWHPKQNRIEVVSISIITSNNINKLSMIFPGQYKGEILLLAKTRPNEWTSFL